MLTCSDRLQVNVATLKKEIDEKSKLVDEEERKTKATERLLLSVETKLNVKVCERGEGRGERYRGRGKRREKRRRGKINLTKYYYR